MRQSISIWSVLSVKLLCLRLVTYVMEKVLRIATSCNLGQFISICAISN